MLGPSLGKDRLSFSSSDRKRSVGVLGKTLKVKVLVCDVYLSVKAKLQCVLSYL